MQQIDHLSAFLKMQQIDFKGALKDVKKCYFYNNNCLLL